MMRAIWERSLKYPIAVIAIWVSILAGGALLSTNLSSHLTTSLTVPGSGSEKAEEILNKNFSEKSEGFVTIIYKFGTLPKGEIENLKEKIAASAEILPDSRIIQQQAIAGTLITVLASDETLQESSAHISKLRSALHSSGFKGALVSGPPAIFHDVRPVLAQDLHRGQILALLLAGLFLFLALGFSFALFVPIFFALSSVTLTLGILSLLSDSLLLVLYIPNIVELIGFGLAVDYSLLAIHRFRREAKESPIASNYELVASTMRTAGRTILISGLTVSISLSTLLLFPIPFIRSLGLASVLVPLASSLAALTLLPVLLLSLGRNGAQSYKFHGLIDRSSSSWIVTSLSQLLLKRTKLVFIASLLSLIAIAAPLLALQVTPSSLTAIPEKLESARALDYITSRAGDGVITPVVVMADIGKNYAAKTPDYLRARTDFVEKLSSHPSVLLIAQGEKEPYINSTGRFLRIFIFTKGDLGSIQTQNLVKDLREEIIPKSEFSNFAKIYVGGAPAQGYDLISAVTQSAPTALLFASMIVVLLLMRAFKSVLIPLKALILDFLSLGAALGVLVAMMKYGIASTLFGSYQLPQLEIWVLLLLVAIVLGISMDYEVFIISRMREAWLRSENNEVSVIEGFKESIGVVTSAALIFIGAVSGFIFGHFAGLQELGIGLASAILIDATIVRFFLLPSAMLLLGKRNWWLINNKSR